MGSGMPVAYMPGAVGPASGPAGGAHRDTGRGETPRPRREPGEPPIRRFPAALPVSGRAHRLGRGR
ncbi:hypothetical protein HMPREF0043_00630 [Actinobaculum sp. oral taxon 183 str. F0552]|nr:hypothetical protein HMPREF0043_00630 [Actinobaculum sp. oral taxon 183 str. F0552]